MMSRRNIVFVLTSAFICVILLLVWRRQVEQENMTTVTTHQHTGKQNYYRLRHNRRKYGEDHIYKTKAHLIHTGNDEEDRQYFANLKGRLDRVNKHCAGVKNREKKRDVAMYPPDNLIVNEEHRIIYCNVPKVGCTNWKLIFLKLGGYDKLKTVALDQLGSNAKGRIYLDYLHKYPNVTHRRFLLQNFTKFVFVRHPFTRILSAFRNKLAPNISYAFQTEVGTERWISNYGRKIIEKYRGEAEAKRVSLNWNTEYDLTFNEFIRFLVDPYTDSYNKHWSDISSMCLPCDIDYDVIGKYETLDTDAEYVLRLANVDPKIKFPKPDPSTVTNSSADDVTHRYYKDVPKFLLYQLAKLYDLDFELFGYDPTPFLNL